MKRWPWLSALMITALLWALAVARGEAVQPEGTLTVAVATFGNERWLPHLYVGAEDVVLKPLWENLKRRPVDRAVFAAALRARSYPGVALAYAGPIIAPEPWELFFRISHSKGAVHLLTEHPKLDAFIERLVAEPSATERARIMREELGPWLYEYLPAVSIGATHSIAGVGPKVGDWPLVPGHMGVHNWEYVARVR